MTNKFKPVDDIPVGRPPLPEDMTWISTSPQQPVYRVAITPDGELVALHLMRCEGRPLGCGVPLPNGGWGGSLLGYPVSMLYWEVTPLARLEYEETTSEEEKGS